VRIESRDLTDGRTGQFSDEKLMQVTFFAKSSERDSNDKEEL